MNETELIALVEEVLEVDAGTVGLDDNLIEIDWDSLCNITFIAEVDTRVGREIAASDLASAVTVRDLAALVR